jgi:UDP-N-acetylglucosamine 1-carboxyvinyltransferase
MIRIMGPNRPRSIGVIRTLPYPGFPTDLQAPILTLMTIARGESIIVENIFKNRYKHVDELIRMGAIIRVEGGTALVKVVRQLTGAQVRAFDIRGGAALVLAGLAAEGETCISNSFQIDRGYEILDEKLSHLGADIRREND